MSSVIISGDTSGQITVSAPAVSGTNTLTLQAATATNSVNTLATAVATTSGTSIEFTALPAWVKRLTVMFTGVSTNGTSNLLVQLGTGSTTYTTTGYLGTCSYVGASTAASTQMSTGFMVNNNMVAADLIGGVITLSLINASTNTWGVSGNLGRSTTTLAFFCGGSIPLASTLSAIRLTTVNGTDTFDAGSVNILYEG
jgi:hypothetical protein